MPGRCAWQGKSTKPIRDMKTAEGEEVQKISSVNWNNFNITTNDEVYQNISSALSDTGTPVSYTHLATYRAFPADSRGTCADPGAVL